MTTPGNRHPEAASELSEPPGYLGDAVDSTLKFTTFDSNGWSDVSGASNEYYYDTDSAQSEDTMADSDGKSWMQTIVDSDNSEGKRKREKEKKGEQAFDLGIPGE